MPIDAKRLGRFDPLGVPVVTDLLGEIDDWDAEKGKKEGEEGKGGPGEKMLADYEKTSLRPYVEFFKGHVAEILKEERGVKREREEGDPMEF